MTHPDDPQPAPRPDRELCPVCGAACTDRGCKLVCDRCRVVVRNCSE